MNRAILSVTERAVKQIKVLLEKQPSFGIRIGVKSGGCSGYSYYLEYADNQNNFDEVVEDKGIRILIDPKALMYIIFSEMDYVETISKSGFTFNNPNAKGSCGCGKSFST